MTREFIFKRLHSLAGLWLVIYLILHLMTNSQAALFFGDDGKGFIHGVNSIHELPYLPLIEILILAVPIFIHMIWGIEYARRANYNSFGNTGDKPYLPEYPRNRAYTWQRITSWLLVIGIIAHVIHMRVVEYPLSASLGKEQMFTVRVSRDDGLYTLAERIGAKIYDQKEINSFKQTVKEGDRIDMNHSNVTSNDSTHRLIEQQNQTQHKNWVEMLLKRPLNQGEVIVEANNFGTVELLMLRDTFKMPIMIVLYTLFVLTTCFHAFNGLWTVMITWGITLTERSQILMRYLCNTLMVVVAAMGLSAIWFTYWINLRS